MWTIVNPFFFFSLPCVQVFLKNSWQKGEKEFSKGPCVGFIVTLERTDFVNCTSHMMPQITWGSAQSFLTVKYQHTETSKNKKIPWKDVDAAI